MANYKTTPLIFMCDLKFCVPRNSRDCYQYYRDYLSGTSYINWPDTSTFATESRNWLCLKQTAQSNNDTYGPSHAPCVFGDMQTAKAQIILRFRAVWSGPSLSANRIIGYYRMYEWSAKYPDDTLSMRRMIGMRILRMFEGAFPLDAAHIAIRRAALGSNNYCLNSIHCTYN